jgi:hypothetical protein
MEKTRLDYLVLSTTLLYFQKEHYTTTARVVLVLSILLLVLVQLSALTFHLQVSLSPLGGQTNMYKKLSSKMGLHVGHRLVLEKQRSATVQSNRSSSAFFPLPDTAYLWTSQSSLGITLLCASFRDVMSQPLT